MSKGEGMNIAELVENLEIAKSTLEECLKAHRQ
jgi:hypothetical protein